MFLYQIECIVTRKWNFHIIDSVLKLRLGNVTIRMAPSVNGEKLAIGQVIFFSKFSLEEIERKTEPWDIFGL